MNNINLWCDYLVEDVQKEIASHLNVLARIRLSETCKACWKMFHPRPFPSDADLLKYVNDDEANLASVIWYMTHFGIFDISKDSFPRVVMNLDRPNKKFNFHLWRWLNAPLEVFISHGDFDSYLALLKRDWTPCRESISGAIQGGNLSIVQHLVETYPFIRRLDGYPGYISLALTTGQLAIAEWLKKFAHEEKRRLHKNDNVTDYF
jgi:hypothetical protein